MCDRESNPVPAPTGCASDPFARNARIADMKAKCAEEPLPMVRDLHRRKQQLMARQLDIATKMCYVDQLLSLFE